MSVNVPSTLPADPGAPAGQCASCYARLAQGEARAHVIAQVTNDNAFLCMACWTEARAHICQTAGRRRERMGPAAVHPVDEPVGPPDTTTF